MVDIFSAALSGANFGPWVPPYVAFLDEQRERVGEGIGHFFGTLRIDSFRSADDFKKHMDKWIRRFRQAEPTTGQERIMIPGDPERAFEQARRLHGIPLIDTVVKDLQGVADKLELDF